MRHSYDSSSRHNHMQWLVLQSTLGEMDAVLGDPTTLISGDDDDDDDILNFGVIQT